MRLRDKTKLTTEEYHKLLENLGTYTLAPHFHEGLCYTAITDGSGFTSYHFITDNEVIEAEPIEVVNYKVIIDLSDAKKSTLRINDEEYDIPKSGIVELIRVKGTLLTYEILLEGWLPITGEIVFDENKQVELTWTKSEE